MIKKYTFSIILLFFLINCKSSDETDNDKSKDSFDRKSLLTNLADNIIIPVFSDFKLKLVELDKSKNNFLENTTSGNLSDLSNSWLEAYKTWQHVEMFNIGKAESINQYYFFINVYPTNPNDIESAANTKNYDLNNSNFHDAQGFPAIDYLIHSDNSLDRFTNNKNASAYKEYLKVLIDRMIDLTNQVIEDWNNGYRNKFISNNESTSSGSLDKIVNDFIFYYEKGFRTNKIGIPAGSFSGNPEPTKVEALYKKDVSKILLLEAFNAIQNVFNGTHYKKQEVGESFVTYLNFLKKSNVVEAINTEFKKIDIIINDLPDNFNQQIIDDNTKMTKAFDAIQKAVPLLKVDMAQSFDVSIDYVDADGD